MLTRDDSEESHIQSVMKKLSKKGKVHPSPAPNLSFLPATILTLAAALSPEDKQVLAYLISCYASSSNNSTTISLDHNYKNTHKSCGDGEHEPLFDCCCFRCYKSFWARWDTSPNRQLIHEIIEVYEEGKLFPENNKRSLKKKKKKKKRGKRVCDEEFKSGDSGSPEVIISSGAAAEVIDEGDYGGDDDENEKVSATKIVNFLGQRIWNFWSIK